jgi:NAD(P) transhydrogenase
MTNRMLGMFKRAGDAPKYEQLYLLPFIGAAAAAVITGGASGTIPLLYLASALSCIFAIGGLATQETAAKGNILGVVGVGGGIAATLLGAGAPKPLLMQMMGTMATGSVAGAWCSFPLKLCFYSIFPPSRHDCLHL